MRAIATVILAAACAGSAAFAGDAPIKFEQAGDHVGEDVTVDGRILGTHCSPTACVLAFDPTFNKLTAIVNANLFDAFPPQELDRLYAGRRVRVHGKVELHDGKPTITVHGADDLMLVHGDRRQQKDSERTLREQADVLDRLGDVLDQVTQLTERMAATQERMETLLAQMEQQANQLASAQAAAQPPPPPPAPSYGVPQPRPGFESLRTIKRGMSRNDVYRLYGQPSYVEQSGGGWATWYYGGGRSVTFDGRGRVQSFVAIPQP